MTAAPSLPEYRPGSPAEEGQRRLLAVAATTPADLRDLRWLDERIEAIDDGMEAVLDIASNWTEGRAVSRLYPAMSAAEYILNRVKPLGRGVILPLLTASNLSNRQIAAVAGVGEATVRRTASSGAVDRPAETLGADGKLRPARVVREVTAEVLEEEASIEEPDGWSALLAVMNAIEALARTDAASIAATVPDRRRAATARRLRNLDIALGRIAIALERMERPL